MSVALLVGLSLLLVAGLLFLLRQITQALRAKGRAELEQRYSPNTVLRAETLAQSFGQQSKGVTQVRGNGVLALTTDELCFVMYLPRRELTIPLRSITAVSHPRSHLGKSQGARLLHIRYSSAGVEDAIAWRVPDPDAWKAQIEALRG